MQGLQAEGVGNLEVGAFAIRPDGVDPVFIALAAKTRALDIAVQGRRAEITQYRLRIGGLHGQLVVRTLPGFDRIGVAAHALLFIGPLRRPEPFGRARLRPPPG
ncbi:hypothetical protein D3C85_1000920 [compost metagenome]